MNEDKWNDRNKLIDEISKAIATAHFPIGHDGTYVMPDGLRLTADYYWDRSLTEEQRHSFRQQAYRAYLVLSGYGLERVMALAFEEYVDEK